MDDARRSAFSIRLRRAGDDSWTDESRSCWLRTGPGPRFNLRLVGSSRASLRGLRCGPRLWLRDSGHRLLRAIARMEGEDQLSVEALRWVEPPPIPPRSEGDIEVRYAPNSGAFHSEDGRLVGRAQPELGRLTATLRGADGRLRAFEGLWGRGVLVLVEDGRRSSVHAVTAQADGGYRIHASGSLLREATAPRQGVEA